MPIRHRPHYRQQIMDEDHVLIPGQMHGFPGDRFVIYAVAPAWADDPEHPEAQHLPLSRVDIDPCSRDIHVTFPTALSGTLYVLAIAQRPTRPRRPARGDPA